MFGKDRFWDEQRRLSLNNLERYDSTGVILTAERPTPRKPGDLFRNRLSERAEYIVPGCVESSVWRLQANVDSIRALLLAARGMGSGRFLDPRHRAM